MKTKARLHKRNRHQGRYDLPGLVAVNAALKPHLRLNPRKESTIDFSDPAAVQELNRALLMHYYGLSYWQIPAGYLCPPIPGRADYIHYAADLLLELNGRANFKGQHIQALDIGTGANLIYPIIGSQAYGWQFVASEVDPVSVQSASGIVAKNAVLKGRISIRQQKKPDQIFNGIIKPEDYFHLVLCNPPFFKSKADAAEARQRKARNLSRHSAAKPNSEHGGANFGGVSNELYCPGGELTFVKSMIRESQQYGSQIGWFTTLVSDGGHVKVLEKAIAAAGALDSRVISMSQGQKVSRLLVWTFKSPKQLKALLNLQPPSNL